MDEGASAPLPLHSKAPNVVYGFIGLGNMGSGMAKNVRQKIPKSSKLIVCELVRELRDDFCAANEGLIETADTPKEVAEHCVCVQHMARSASSPSSESTHTQTTRA